MSDPAIGLLCRPPSAARAKFERIAGASHGFALGRAFLEDSIALGQEVARRETARFVAFHSPADSGAEMAELFPGLTLHPQADAGLGPRRERAAAHLFSRGAGPVVVMTMDSPTLPPALLELLFDALRSGADAACIPALDGGYCAIGFARPLPVLLRDIDATGPELVAATRARARAEGLSFRELQFWLDVDEAGDMKFLRISLDGLAPPSCSPLPPFAANATRAVLEG